MIKSFYFMILISKSKESERRSCVNCVWNLHVCLSVIFYISSLIFDAREKIISGLDRFVKIYLKPDI